jgi:hypothetical protein
MSSFTRSILIAVASVSFAGSASLLAQNSDTVVQTPDIDTSPYIFAGEVNSDLAVVRSGPSENDYQTLKLAKGTKLVVVGYRLDWLKIEPPAGSFCLVSQAFVDKRGDGTVGRISNQRATIRVGSALTLAKHKVPVQLDPGTDVQILGEVDEYYKIAPPKGVYMYIDKKFVNPVRKLEDNTATANGQPSNPTTPTNTPPSQPTDTTTAPPPVVTNTPPATGDNTFRVTSSEETAPSGTTPSAETSKELDTPKVPVSSIQKLQEQLAKLEDDYAAAAQKDITEQPIDQLLEGYNGLLADQQLPPNARKVAEYRANALKLRKETLDQFLATKKMQAEIAQKQQDLKAEQDELQHRVAENAVKRYTAIGRLVQSSLQIGNQTLYRLVDPATSRTIIYVRTSEKPLGENLDKFVAIEGQVVTDAAAKLTYVQPAKVDVVDSKQVNVKIFADYSPPSLSTQTVAGETQAPPAP